MSDNLPDPSGFDLTKDTYPPGFNTYLPNGAYHVGMELRAPEPTYGLTELCAICHGYGGWNLKLNAYTLSDGSKQHFNACCSHCNGWGFVKPGENDCAPHDWEEVSRPSGHHSGLHTDRCKKCGKHRTYDTSD